jgi:multiple sugar transport system substrate-binding protein
VPKGSANRYHNRKTVTRRAFLKMSVGAAAGMALAGCAPPKPGPPPQTGEKVQLVYQDWRTDWFPPMARRMLEDFHATHPNIKVFYVPDPEVLEDKMLADMQAGTAPDVFQGCCVDFPIWAQKGYTLDLRPFVQADLDQAVIGEWDQAQYRAFFTRDGRQFGLPKYHGALALYYNKNLFDRYRVPYPEDGWDHDDYLQAMKQLTREDSGPGGSRLWGSMIDIGWDRLQVHVNGWGGHFVDPNDPTRCRMGDPEALRAFEWIQSRMWNDRVMPSFPDVEDVGTIQAFVSGRLAMVEDGSWALKDILSKANFRVGVAPFPAGPARKVTLASTDGFGIYAGTRHPEAAWELLKFLISKDYGRAMARANFLQPARASLVEEWVQFIREEFPEKARDMDIAAFADGHLKGYSVTAEIFPNMDDAKRIAYSAWDQIFTLGHAQVDQMKDVSRQIENAQRKTQEGG